MGEALHTIWTAGAEGAFRLDGEAGSAVFAAAERAAARLRAAGVGPGAVVVHQAPQHRDGFVLFWATMALGAVFAPIDPTWPEPLLRDAAGALSPRAVAGDADRIGALRRVFPHAAAVEIGPDAALADWAGEPGQAVSFEAGDPEADAAYLFTSGSTGAPKAVRLSRRALAASGRLVAETFGWRCGDRLINLAEPHTMSGLRNAFVSAPAAGLDWLPTLPSERFDVFALVEQLAQTGCQRLVAGPSLLRHFALMGGRIDPESLSALEAVYCTGAAMNGADATAFYARFGAPVIDYYGLTETGGLCLSQRLEGWTPGDTALGYPVGCEVRLVDASGAALPDGPGELQVKSPQLMSGYLGDAAATAERFDGDWLRTGDLMRRAPDGAFELIGRLAAFIKTAAGERVHPREIEAVLESDAAVSEAAVCGLATGGGPERICAAVTLGSPASAAPDLPQRLAVLVAERLGSARRPARVVVVERLPRGENGKLSRSALESLFQ